MSLRKAWPAGLWLVQALLALSLLAFAPAAQAQDNAPDKARDWARDWAGLQQAGEGIQTLAADFVQEKHLKFLTKPLLSQGKVYYQAPDEIRWEFTSPLATVTILKGGGVSRYVKTDGVWREDSPQAAAGLGAMLQEMRLWMSGRFSPDSPFHPTLEPGPPPRIVLTPGPELAKFVGQVVLFPGPRPGVMDRVEIAEYDQSQTVIRFENVRLNQPLPPEIFAKP
ncbi:MAG: outer membrane lipoprotein carrier protein LolA [Deltaproteobacteria bacterium]|nr:outer membrane lipoprotein carrier protein LolA [Deltaproteobacteria bacterium]